MEEEGEGEGVRFENRIGPKVNVTLCQCGQFCDRNKILHLLPTFPII